LTTFSPNSIFIIVKLRNVNKLCKGGQEVLKSKIINAARNIRAERVRNNLTQQKIAKKIGLSVTGYNQKETGKRQFSLEEFVLICEILNTDPETLLRNPS
jgi:DNA-binding XRE family transcriptional regulator